jgi:hypothetical protein
MKTVWTLDVDGVINATKAGWGRGPRHRHVLTYRLAWEPDLVKAIRDIHTSGLAEVVWSTTWCPDADLLENLWGLPKLRRAWDRYPEGGYVGDLKLNAARQVLAEGNRLIWTDDTETPSPEVLPDIYREMMDTGRALLIRPKPSRGLRPDDIADIKKFCAEGK